MRLGPQTAFRLLREWQGSGFIEDKAEQGSGQTQPLVDRHATGLLTVSYDRISKLRCRNSPIESVLFCAER